MAGLLTTLLTDYQTHLKRFRNRRFLRATMAACSLVAIAEGEISLGERIRGGAEPQSGELTPEQRESLEALGYLEED